MDQCRVRIDPPVFSGSASRAVISISHASIAVPAMDRQTRLTLWIAFLVLFSYFAWFFLDCAMDESCHLVCRYGGRGGCYTTHTPEVKPP
jgi:hypothetical protein